MKAAYRILEKLEKKKVDWLDTKDSEGKNVLAYVIEYGDPIQVSLNDVSFIEQRKEKVKAPRFAIEMINRMTESQLNAKDNKGESAVHWSISKGYLGVFYALMTRNVDVTVDGAFALAMQHCETVMLIEIEKKIRETKGMQKLWSPEKGEFDEVAHALVCDDLAKKTENKRYWEFRKYMLLHGLH